MDGAAEGSTFTFLLEFSSHLRPMVKGMSKEVDRNVIESPTRFRELGEPAVEAVGS